MPKETFLNLWSTKQEHIIRSAITEFNKNGFARTTIEGITQASGIAKGSFYQYFEDKKDIFLYCADWGLSIFMEKLAKQINLDQMDVFEYFQENLTKQAVIDEERELTVFMQIIAHEPGLSDEAIKRMYLVGDQYINRLIQTSINRGTVRDDIDWDLLKEYFIAVTDQFKRRWMTRFFDFTQGKIVSDEKALEKELAQMLTLLKTGMGR